MSANKLLDSESISVEFEDVIDLEVKSHQAFDQISNALVLSVEYLDRDAKEIPFKAPGLSSSKKFRNYSYLNIGTKANPSISNVSLVIPASAVTAKIEVITWTDMVKPVAQISYSIAHRSFETTIGDTPFVFIRPVSSLWRYHIQLFISCDRMFENNPGTLEIEYLTEKLKSLSPRREEYLHWSKRYQSYYRYLTPIEIEGAYLDHELLPPASASYCVIKIRNTSSKNIEIRIDGPSESSLEWSHSDRNHLRSELARTDHKATRNKMSAIIEALPDGEGLEAATYEFSVRRGDLNLAKTAAIDSYRKKPGERSLHRLRFITELLETLNPEWSPNLGSTMGNYEAEEKKIAHLFKVNYPYESSGGAIRNLNVVKCQKSIGWNPFVVTPLGYPRSHGFDDFEPMISVGGIRHIHLDLGSAPSKTLRYASRNIEFNTYLLQSILLKESPSIIHAASGYRGFELAVMAKAISEQTGIPWIYEVRSFHEQTWTDDRQHSIDSVRTKLREKRENSLMNQADAIVTISESMAKAITGRGVDPEKITIVPNAVDPSEFKPGKKNNKLAKSLGLSKKFIVGYISNISKREGHDVLVEAFSAVSDVIENSMLLIVGDGKEKERISRLVSEYGLSEKVIMTGEVDHAQIQDYYRLIDIFVVPRRRDYAADYVTPLKPFEAMALEIPLIVSDREALMEIIGSDRGHSFSTGDADDLARVLLDCHDNYDLCTKMANIARQWIIENRTWEKNAMIYNDLYESLIAG